MVTEMENSGEEVVRSSSVGSVVENCTSARQSPKISGLQPMLLATGNCASSSPSVNVPRKIMSKNNNNTMFLTSLPSNFAELQLYRVMQHASLLYYYDTLLEMGGDDVQQLCDAGEEEFLEIMSLVGMASKPLHVRRLQKSLQEWVTNPAKFKMPLIPGDDFEVELSSTRVTGSYYAIEGGEPTSRTVYSPAPADSLTPTSGLTISNKRSYSPLETQSCPPSSSSSPGSSNSISSNPTLKDSHINKLAVAAERLSKLLPQFEPKPQNTKKKVCKELELVMSMSETDPRRMDEIRKYAAIYGRFDCKRKPEKPLTLHEVSVNEAAAQICRFVPALLTRRDELFPLARQVVKDAGCHYSKTHYSTVHLSKSGSERDMIDIVGSSNAGRVTRLSTDGDLPPSKRQRFDTDSENDEQVLKRQDKCDDHSRPSLHSLFRRNRENHRRSFSVMMDDESDSHFSFSNSSSPSEVCSQEQDQSQSDGNGCQTTTDQNEEQEETKYSPKVIAASGDNIIAVANPALAMSPAILPMAIEKLENNLTDQ